MNLVVGATGLVGGEVCSLLAGKGKTVKALVRSTTDPSKLQRIKAMGAELVQGDVKDRASLDAACQGVQTVLSTASSTLSRQSGDSIDTVDLRGQLNLIDAASAGGVKHFIYVSISGNIDMDSPLRNAKRTVESYLKGSGITYTILRPTCFIEAWLSPAVGFDFANAKAQIYGSGRNKISWISYRDVARFAAASVENNAARNAVIELGGPEALSPLEVVRIFEEASGRKFEIQHVPEETLHAQRASATDPMQRSFAALMLAYARGDVIDMTKTLQKFPIQMSSVREYAKRTLGKA